MISFSPEVSDVLASIIKFFEIFFVVYLIGYASFLFISVIVGSNEVFTGIKKKHLRNEIHHDYYVPVTIIVPAYNEAVTICKSIESLLNLDYKTYEIVVVNDGSKDETANVVINHFNLHKVNRPIRRQVQCKDAVAVYEGISENGVSIVLIDKENGGKADSINMGINVSKFPYFVCMDADSILEKDSLKKIAVPVLENQDVVAVGSMIRISNGSKFENGELKELRLPKKLLPAFQVLEYERSFLASRIFLDKFNANLVISGAFGLFKKDAVISVGGYKVGCIGEDMELVMNLHEYHRKNNLPYVIKYSYDAICWTQAPERMRDLIKQRRRWHIGLMQSMFTHKSLMSVVSYFYFLFYELLSPAIELTGIILTIIAGLLGLLNVPVTIALFLVYALFGAMLTVISFVSRNFNSDQRLRISDVIKAFLLCVPENIFIRLFMAFTRMFAVFFMRGKKTKWGEIKRYSINYGEAEKEKVS